MKYIFLILLIAAVLLMLFSDNHQVIKLKKGYYKVKKYQTRKKVQFKQNDLNEEFHKAGFLFDLYKYQTVRYTVTAVLMALNILYIFQLKQIHTGLILITVGLYVASIPKTYVMKFKTPLKRVIDISTKKRKEQYNREMGLFIIQLANNFNLYKGNPPSAIHMINEAMVGMDKVEPIFKNYLRYLQINKHEEGIQYFVNTIDTEEAKRLASVLSKLDELKPSDLKDQLEFQKANFQEKRKISKKNKIKSQNYKITALSSATLIIILLNIIQSVLSIFNTTGFMGF
ncbi:hypothetical protein MKX73_19065 [Solibacillus sp. FSL W7-1436]|uniref:hypothetical protein n=1 Tax=Solibacillus sp. FSL W7-1436 TaxID=2921705 RepID=UPI0030F55C92